MRILLVDDNEMNIDMLSRRRLERKGLSVVSAMDGIEAIESAHAVLPDLILLDMGLPGISGWEVAARLKSQAATSAIPIIALTARATEADRRQALDAGCNDFDTKPVDLPRLLEKIAALAPKASVTS